MNRIENEQIKFYLEHEARIREWSGLEAEVSKFVDRFYRSLKDDLDAAIKSGRIGDDGVESFLQEGDWPGLCLRRRDWPSGDGEPQVRLEWSRKSARFSASGWLVCGVTSNAKHYKGPFTKEARPAFPLSSPWWLAYRQVDPPDGRFWEGDNLKQYRGYLVETILKAWENLAPLVDEAVRKPSN